MKSVVVVGGGTGTFAVLTGLRNYYIQLSVIVSMMDSGGSTGRLRDQLGVLPPGDLRQCLVALSDAPALWRDLFVYRFERGDLKGHNFGNVFISALEKLSKDYQEVIDNASQILKTVGKVIPVTFNKSHLCVEYEDGTVLVREGEIDKSKILKSRIVNTYLVPKAKVNTEASAAISNADFLIVGPGDIYTSIVPNLVVEGVNHAIRNSKCKVIYVLNLVTKNGQTTDYTALDHVRDIEKYLGRRADYILVNSREVPAKLTSRYAAAGEKEVVDDLGDDLRVVREDLLSMLVVKKHSSDRAIRSLIRHDPQKLGDALMRLIGSSQSKLEKIDDYLKDVWSHLAS